MIGRSRKGAWIEIDDGLPWNTIGRGRSRKGAWIEIPFASPHQGGRRLVAPVRERGLKLEVTGKQQFMGFMSLP